MEEATEIPFENSADERAEDVSGLGEEQTAPWLSAATRAISNPNFRLHNEIIDFYNHVKPSEATNSARHKCFLRVKDILEKDIAGSFVGAFGSFATQLYLPNSDVDLVIINENYSAAELIKLTKRALKAHAPLFTNIEAVQAKVPVVKFSMEEARIEFDITFNESTGITNAREVISALQAHPEIPYLVFIAKMALRQRHMNNTYQGGVGSYLLFLMVLTFVREYKRELLRTRRRGLSQATLAEYLVNFLLYWGRFQFHTHEVVIADGGRVQRKRHASDALTIYSPINNEDVGGGAFRFRTIFSVFKNRANFLCNYPYREGESILKYLLNPSRKDFQIYFN